jgi:transcriptional regulator with XRE-family HTH domain
MVLLNTAVIDRERLLRGWSWSDLGRAAGFSQPTRTKIANGRGVSIVTARRLCEAMGLSLKKVLVFDAPTRPQTTAPGAIQASA